MDGIAGLAGFSGVSGAGFQPQWEFTKPVKNFGNVGGKTSEAVRSLRTAEGWKGMRPDGAEKPVNPFTDIFRAAIRSVQETDEENSRMEYLMATGQLDNPALLTNAATKAELAVDLLVQLRNKAQETYNELMRISM